METGKDAPDVAVKNAGQGGAESLEEIVKAGIQTMKELEAKARTGEAGSVYTR